MFSHYTHVFIYFTARFVINFEFTFAGENKMLRQTNWSFFIQVLCLNCFVITEYGNKLKATLNCTGNKKIKF